MGNSKWFLLCWVSTLLLIRYSSAQHQLPMPATYLPKEYFLSDGRRDPRHLQNQPYPDQVASEGSITTTTYHLNPTANPNYPDPNPSLFQDRSLQVPISNTHPIMNNQFGNRIQPYQPNPQPQPKSSSKRHRRRQGKTPRSLRPPKDYIIYSLPEQSFYSGPGPQQGLQGQGVVNNALDAEESDEDDDEEEISTSPKDLSQSQSSTSQSDKEGQSSSQGQGSVEEVGGTVTLGEKKVRLGQCMKYCMDAIL